MLPALGVDVGERVASTIELFKQVEVFYLEVSLLEAIWKLLRVASEKVLDRVEEGLKAIRETYSLLEPPPEAFIDAYCMFWAGCRNYIDCLLYSTAWRTGLLLLTIDQSLVSFLLEKSYPAEFVISPEKLQRLLRESQ